MENRPNFKYKANSPLKSITFLKMFHLIISTIPTVSVLFFHDYWNAILTNLLLVSHWFSALVLDCKVTQPSIFQNFTIGMGAGAGAQNTLSIAVMAGTCSPQ